MTGSIKKPFFLLPSSHPLSGVVVRSGSSSFARHLRGREKKVQLEPGLTTGNSPVINAEVKAPGPSGTTLRTRTSL